MDLSDEIYFEGESVDALEVSMKRAVDHYLEVCAARGEEPARPFSGKLNVRLGSELHRAAAVAAAAHASSGRLLSSLLFGVRSWDPASFLAAATVLGSVATLAAWLPARRAVTIDPKEALRAD